MSTIQGGKMRVQSVIALIIALVACFGAAGCGGDGDGGANSSFPEVTTSSLTKAQFMRRADEACKAERANLLTRIAAFSKKNIDSPADEGSPEYANLVAAAFLPTFRAELNAVRGLGAPKGDEAEVEEMLATQARAIEEVAAQGVETFEELEAGFELPSKLFVAYGLMGCSFSNGVAIGS